MKKILLILSFVALLMPIGTNAQSYSYEGAKPNVVIDVRTPEEFSAGHVKGAVNIPYDTIKTGIASLKGLTKDQSVLLYCRSGRRSSIAKQELEKLGFTKVLDGGGMDSLLAKLKTCTAANC